MSKNIKISKRLLDYINYSAIARELKLSPSYVSLILSDKRKAPKARARIIELIRKELRAV